MPPVKAIKKPEDLFELFLAYKTKVKGDPILVTDWVGKDADKVNRPKEKPLTYEGFQNYVEDLGIISTLDHYFINYEKRYEVFVGICSRIKRHIRQDQIEGGMAGIYNPSITQRLNGLAEKTETKVDITEDDHIDYDQLSDAALEEITKARRK